MEAIEETVVLRSPTHRHGNVLLIEDNSDTAEAVARVLADAGYGVRTVKDRNAALNALRMNLYSIALMDLFMPGMNAKDFVSQASGISPRTKIVLMTAGVRNASTHAQELGLEYWLSKPFCADDLIGLMQTA